MTEDVATSGMCQAASPLMAATYTCLLASNLLHDFLLMYIAFNFACLSDT